MNMPATQDVTNVSSTNLIMQSDSFDRVMRLADLMASGKAMVPEHLQKNAADCAAIIMQSMQWNMNPFAVAQKTFIISGKLGYEAQLVNAVITSIAPTKDRLNFEWFGDWDKIIGKFEERTSQTKKDDSGQPKKYKVPAWKSADEAGLGVKVWATLKGEDRPRELVLMLSQALTRNSTLWVEDPRQQLAYLGIKRWSRLYCPDVILGVYTPDELEQITEREINPAPSSKIIERTTENDSLIVPTGSVGEQEITRLRDAIKVAGITEEEFCRNKKINIEALDQLPMAKFVGALAMLKKFAETVQ